MNDFKKTILTLMTYRSRDMMKFSYEIQELGLQSPKNPRVHRLLRITYHIRDCRKWGNYDRKLWTDALCHWLRNDHPVTYSPCN